MSGHRFAVVALISISLASSLWFLLDVISAYSYSSEAFGVAAFEKRFQLLRQNLPPRSVLGYISDNPPDNTQAQAEFYLTEYALAPAIIKASTGEQLEVANFHTNTPNPALLKAKNLTLVQDFGNDVFLYRNNTR